MANTVLMIVVKVVMVVTFFGEIVWRNHFALGYQGRDPWEKVDQPTK